MAEAIDFGEIARLLVISSREILQGLWVNPFDAEVIPQNK